MTHAGERCRESQAGDNARFAALVYAAAAGDDAAMEALLVRTQEVAYRFSMLMCDRPEDAEDVMQEALLKTYRSVARIREPEAFRTWLYRTVRNTSLMRRRRRVGEPRDVVSIEHSMTEHGDSSMDIADARVRLPDQLAIDAAAGAALRRALQRLPHGYRVIVVLRDVEGLSTREVASVTGLSEANVKTRLHRARLMLRSMLAPELSFAATPLAAMSR